jgi:predicted TIM-barrel fold metal-dependent hydrolase
MFQKHPGRFMIGTDTYVTSRWGSYLELIEEHRAWLGQLPRDVAEKIAYRNAVSLFGAGGRSELSR